MNWTNDEKLTLFLIWWHCEEEISLDSLEREFNDSVLACGIEKDVGFIQFTLEAHEAKEEEFEFWVSDMGFDTIKNLNGFELLSIKRNSDGYHKRKITITIEN